QARVHTAARHGRMAPAALADAVNTDLFASTQGQRYATVIYGTLDATARRLCLVNAGHPAALVLEPEATVPALLESSGPALGLMDTAHFETVETTLPPGSLLVAFSDGVVEAMDAQDEEFGIERVVTLLLARRRASAAELCAALLDAVRRHRGARQHQDDVTVLVVRAV
ncbi:MAG: serine/threonine-protein phosphatase, partial [Acidobacteriota bacterium]|nr:serine/threonine-protein phosphatase [Acidobacteriota bacterium]